MSAVIKILGILDIFAAIVFWIFGIFKLQENTMIVGLLMFLGIYLLIKGVVFLISADIASVLDIISAFIIIGATAVIMPKIVVIIVSLYLLQKGIFSLMS
ncbi:hypothetical protein GOV12_01105 [Candidatus Pacearchaeota archaeon]|nr:hypothetical protein [Candidatus Pacearchaeota archaeon]